MYGLTLQMKGEVGQIEEILRRTVCMKPLDGDMMSYFVSCLMAAIYNVVELSSHMGC